jgi:glutamate formiminotransferase
MTIVECVPNFSEGRRPEVLERIVASMAKAPGVRVIDQSMDPAHNRAVVTLIGGDGEIGEAAFRGIAQAQREIDLTQHSGEHPRIGATDVVPFGPVAGVSIERCVEIAHAVGERVGRELSIPVYFYEAAALRPERRNLPKVRNIGFEKLRDAVGSDPERTPDHGPAVLHPTAGATVIGARQFLIAFNVNLETTDLALAKEIAKQIREKDGGLPGIKAMGFFLDELNCAQVSMNVCDFQSTGLERVFQEIEQRAKAVGVAIRESELVGLAPRAALGDGLAARIRLRGFDPKRQIVEELL